MGYCRNQYKVVLSILRHLFYQNMVLCTINYQYLRFLSSPKTPDPDMDLVNLQFWNCMDYDFTVIVKQFVAPMEWETRTRHFGNQKGQYICTLDNYHGDFDQIQLTTPQVKCLMNISHLTLLNWKMGSLHSIQTTDVVSMTPQ